jgi:chemotaxis protein MotB
MTRRKKRHAAHANHERWMVSYADFVTLLFAFFVVMFATANADKHKAKVVSEAVRAALGQRNSREVADVFGNMVGSGQGVDHAPKIDEQARLTRTTAELMPYMQLLQKSLQAEIKKGNVEVRMAARGLTISFKQAAFFDSGSDVIKPSAIGTIGTVGQALLKIPNAVRLEGHTDNVPIAKGRFSNNWELSSSRAIAVLEVLTNQFGIPRSRLAVGGYADVAPIASNDTEEGRARNRRVDVVILSEYGATNEPNPSNKN